MSFGVLSSTLTATLPTVILTKEESSALSEVEGPSASAYAQGDP